MVENTLAHQLQAIVSEMDSSDEQYPPLINLTYALSYLENDPISGIGSFVSALTEGEISETFNYYLMATFACLLDAILMLEAEGGVSAAESLVQVYNEYLSR